MFCWGNMKNGELGLGGLEEEIATEPRLSPFALTDKVIEGIFSIYFLIYYYFKNTFEVISFKLKLDVEKTIQF